LPIEFLEEEKIAWNEVSFSRLIEAGDRDEISHTRTLNPLAGDEVGRGSGAHVSFVAARAIELPAGWPFPTSPPLTALALF